MKQTTVIALLVLSAGVTAIAWKVRSGRTEQVTRAANENAKLFPELAASVNEVARVELSRGAERVELAKSGAEWGLASRGGYPVDFGKVRQLILGLSELEPFEAKTSNPGLYAKLGVEDPALPEAKSALVRLLRADGSAAAELIVGNTGYAGRPTVYVRKPSEAQSYLCTGQLGVDPEPANWIVRDVLKLDAARARAVEVVAADGSSVRIERDSAEQQDFRVQDVPPGRELSYPGAASGLASALNWVSVDDVAPRGEVDFAGASVASYRCFDGLLVRAHTVEREGRTWVAFDFEREDAAGPPAPAAEAASQPSTAEAEAAASQPADGAPAASDAADEPSALALKSPEEVQKEVEQLRTQHAAWAYVLPSWKASALRTNLESLLKPLPGAEASEEPSLELPPDGEPNGEPGHEHAHDESVPHDHPHEEPLQEPVQEPTPPPGEPVPPGDS